MWLRACRFLFVFIIVFAAAKQFAERPAGKNDKRERPKAPHGIEAVEFGQLDIFMAVMEKIEKPPSPVNCWYWPLTTRLVLVPIRVRVPPRMAE